MQPTTGSVADTRASISEAGPASPQSSAVDSLMHAMMSIGRLMRSRMSRDDLDPGTFWLLKTLASEGSMRVTDLATCANLDTSTVSRHVAQLHRSRLIERTQDPDDGRAQRVGLSTEGQHVLNESMDRRRTVLHRSFQGWTDDDIQHLDRLLARFVSGMDHQNADLEQA